VRCPGKRRSRSGKGQRIEVNLLSSLLSSLTNQASAYLATGRSPERMGNQHPSVAPYETLRCKDGYLAVCCGNDTQFRRLAAVLEIPFLAEDSRFVTNAARVAHRAELVAAMEEMLRRDTTDVWVARLTDVEVPAGKIATVGTAIDLASSLDLDPIVSFGDEACSQVRHPITYSATPVTRYQPPPRLGADGDEVRRWLSGESDFLRNLGPHVKLDRPRPFTNDSGQVVRAVASGDHDEGVA